MSMTSQEKLLAKICSQKNKCPRIASAKFKLNHPLGPPDI